MPIYNSPVSRIVRGVKAFLGQDSRLTRNDQMRDESSEREHDRTRKQLKETQQRLARVRQKLVDTNAKLAELEAASSRQEQPRKNTPIFFIVGRPKSGTWWMRDMLNPHPEILCDGEGEFFGRDYGSSWESQVGRPLDDIRPPSWRSLYHAVAQSGLLRTWIAQSPWTRGDDIEEHLTNLTREAIYYFLTQRLSKSKRSEKRIVGDKTPFASPEIIKEISTICPEAKVIHIIRDGRDVAVSQLHHMWNDATTTEDREEGGWFLMSPEELDKRDRYRKDPQEFLGSGEGIFTEKRLREAAEGWRSDVGAAHRDGPVLLGDNYTEVRYEIMLERPEEELERLLQFLGARADDKDLIEQCVALQSFKERTGGRKRGQEDAHDFRRKGIAGDWRNVFTESDKAIFKEVAGDLLIELGYENVKDW